METTSRSLFLFGTSSSRDIAHENAWVIDFHLRGNSSVNPVLNPLRPALFGKSEHVRNLRRTAKLLNQCGVVFHLKPRCVRMPCIKHYV